MRPRGCKQIVICCGEMEGRGRELLRGGRRAGPEDGARRCMMEGSEERNPAAREGGDGVKVQRKHFQREATCSNVVRTGKEALLQ